MGLDLSVALLFSTTYALPDALWWRSFGIVVFVFVVVTVLSPFKKSKICFFNKSYSRSAAWQVLVSIEFSVTYGNGAYEVRTHDLLHAMRTGIKFVHFSVTH